MKAYLLTSLGSVYLNKILINRLAHFDADLGVRNVRPSDGPVEQEIDHVLSSFFFGAHALVFILRVQVLVVEQQFCFPNEATCSSTSLKDRKAIFPQRFDTAWSATYFH